MFREKQTLASHLVFPGSLFACQCSKDTGICYIFRALPALQSSDSMSREVVLNYTIHLYTESYFLCGVVVLFKELEESQSVASV